MVKVKIDRPIFYMKKFKSLFLTLLILLFLLSFLRISDPSVLASDKEDIYFRQNEIKNLSRIDEIGFFKIDESSREESVNKLSESIIIEIEKKDLGKMRKIEKNEKNNVEGEVLVKYKKNKINLETSSGRAVAERFNHSKSMEKKEDLKRINVSVLKIKDGKTVEEKIAELKNDPNVEYVEPNYKRYLTAIDSNDTYKNLLWGLDNTGQEVNGTTGMNDADIDAPEAWAISESNSNVIVAVIDSGVAYNHPDLTVNMWDGSVCVDENNNTLGGCNHGYDYEDEDKIPLDNNGHGTHIAGIIGAVKNNNKGIIGVSSNIEIMAIKFGGDIGDEIKAIDFAINNGAKVINASFAGAYSQAEYDAINTFKNAGGLFITAAGNETNNNDAGIHNYPCDCDLDNIICVAATDQDDNLTSWSNYGTTSVDVGAPGKNIYSTIVQETTVLFEDFESVIPPNVPAGFVPTGDWGTYDLDGGLFWGKVLYGDVYNIPYAQTANSTITPPTYNLSATGAAYIDFWAKCDTEYNTDFWTDYMALEISSDGSSFSEWFRFDEVFLDLLNSESPLDPSVGAVYHFGNISIPSQYLTNNFKFRFRWVANGNTDTGGGDGCLIDDIKITKYSDGSDEQYSYMQGTSMATPYVAGLAGLIWGYNSSLSYDQVKNIILTTGDNLLSLSGKTVTGKRINAYNALQLLIDTTNPVITLLGDDPVDLYVGDSYTDAGATALDDIDGDITADIVVGGDTVDTSTIGIYIITYNVLDAASNPADEVTRTVNVSAVPMPSGGGGGGGSYIPPPVFEKSDINKDKKVDKYDFSMMMAAWGKTGSNTSDLNGDNKVNKYDFALLMSKWSTM